MPCLPFILKDIWFSNAFRHLAFCMHLFFIPHLNIPSLCHWHFDILGFVLYSSFLLPFTTVRWRDRNANVDMTGIWLDKRINLSSIQTEMDCCRRCIGHNLFSINCYIKIILGEILLMLCMVRNQGNLSFRKTFISDFNQFSANILT